MPDINDKPELYKYASRQILEKLREELEDMFKVYYYGDPLAIPASYLPCIIVDWGRSTPLPGPTRSDKWRHNITVKIVLNKMDDVGQKLDPNSRIIDVATKEKLERFMFARDAATAQYIDKCVLGVLRRNYTMGGQFTLNESQVEFGTSTRMNDEAKAIVTAEAHLELTLNETVRVPDRA